MDELGVRKHELVKKVDRVVVDRAICDDRCVY